MKKPGTRNLHHVHKKGNRGRGLSLLSFESKYLNLSARKEASLEKVYEGQNHSTTLNKVYKQRNFFKRPLTLSKFWTKVKSWERNHRSESKPAWEDYSLPCTSKRLGTSQQGIVRTGEKGLLPDFTASEGKRRNLESLENVTVSKGHSTIRKDGCRETTSLTFWEKSSQRGS